MSADGTTPRQFILPIERELIVDLFAGGGGMSCAIEQALGRHADIAINHSDDALSMHRANHPQTRHFIADVFEVCPRGATRGRPVGLLHLSPDCTHHSQAAGGQPRNGKIRALSWVGVRWAGQVRPRIITLENVKQIRSWGPLIAKRDKDTGRVLKLDGNVAAHGERVPVQEQFLIPDPKRTGRTWLHFLAVLRGMGYAVEHRILCAADHGAPTTRERLFLVARCDGAPIHWPQPTHYKASGKGQKPWRSAAECMDWSIPCPSIFDRTKPLAEATLRRIAKGVQRYVLDAPQPFIVPAPAKRTVPLLVQAGHGEGKPEARRWSHGHNDIQGPIGTITASGGGQALAAATLVQTGYGERKCQQPRSLDIAAPLGTVVAGAGKHALVSAFLAQHNGNSSGGCPGHDAREPVSTITNTGSQQGLVTVHLATEHAAGALRVAAFLMSYYGNGGERRPDEPIQTITTKDRVALVTVSIRGTPYVIVDIGLRMLTPRELYRAQGFPEHYQIERGHDGRRFTKTQQVRMVGNSVSPQPAVALLRANFSEIRVRAAA